MRDVVIIGGGLSGLAAAHELQRRGVPYRLIEVKKRLGGSIISERRDGFVLDGGPFAFPRRADWSFLEPLGLAGALIPVYDAHRRDLVAFAGGTQVLIEALAKPLTGTILYRMAVSSLGQIDGQYALCLENGLVLDTAAVIVAAPARFAERMFRTVQPELSLKLADYGYDFITRLSLGFREADLPHPPLFPWDMAVAFYEWTDSRQRVPPGCLLLHVGLRVPPSLVEPEALTAIVREQIKAQGDPVIRRLDMWSEADPLPPHQANFRAEMDALLAMLPPGIAMTGSDYHGLGLAERIAGGRAAAEKIAAYLDSRP
jgi:protoporphyrinogen oxidase